MKRKCVISPKNKNVIASSDRFAGVKLAQVRALQRKLQDAYDYLETISDDTYQAIQGDSIASDLDTAVRECQEVLNRMRY